MSRNRLFQVICLLAVAFVIPISWSSRPAIGEDAKPAAAGDYKLPANFKLVCIGDSITQGRKGGGGDSKPTYSWRYPLWKMFVDADIQVDFVGSINGGFNGDPDWADYKGKKFDRDHEGHWGWKTFDISDKLPGWIEKYTPDAAMILLGTNDRKSVEEKGMDPTIAAFTSIIEILRKKNPKVLILISPPFHEWEPFRKMQKALELLAGKLTTKESPIVIIDQSKGWVSDPKNANTCTVDWVHPNEKGDEMLAQKWFEGIKPFIGK